jgi:hypothetical protein
MPALWDLVAHTADHFRPQRDEWILATGFRPRG